jgi:hypothetical protein
MGNGFKSKNSFLEGGTMSHPVNDELLETIWEQVQEEFPFLPIEEQEQLAKQMFEDRCQ